MIIFKLKVVHLINGFYEKTFEQDILDKEFDDTTDGELAMKIIFTVKCQSELACSGFKSDIAI